jgi:hypothetical protein
MKKVNLKKVSFGLFAAVIACGFTSCFSLLGISSSAEGTNTPNVEESQQPKPKGESQFAKFRRLLAEDTEKIQIIDGKTDDASIEAVLQPRVISRLNEITRDKISEPAKPYYFKIRAIYKGYDAEAKEARLQDLGEVQSSTLGNAIGAVFGGDTNVYSTYYHQSAIPSFPEEANTIATFYLVAMRLTENENGDSVNQSAIYIRFIRNAEKPMFDPSKFVVANAMHFITVADAHVPTQQDAMISMMGYGGMNASASVFDPAVYPAIDLLDARIAMDKKNHMRDNTFPTVRVKYVSDVIFKGQSGTTITVSTSDGVSTERMDFGGRAGAIKTGDKIRIYYTIAKDPLEIWEVQALERL